MGGEPRPPAGEVDTAERLAARRVPQLVVARLFGLFADSLSTFVVPVAIFVATGSAVWSGLAFAVQWLPRVVCLPVIGALVDRFDGRRQLVASDLTRAALAAVAALAHDDLVVLVLVSGLLMLVDSHATIATERIVATRVPPSHVVQAQGGLQLDTEVSRAGGPAAGGVLLAMFDVQTTLLLTAALFAVGAVTTWLVLPGGGADRDDVPSGDLRRIGGDLRAGAAFLWRERRLRRLLALVLVINLIGGVLLAGFPPLLLGQFRVSEQYLGVALGVASALSVASTFLITVVGRNERARRRVIAAFVVLMVIATVVVFLGEHPVTVTVGYGLWAAGSAGFAVWARSRRVQLIPPQEIGRTLGIFVSIMLMSAPIGGLVLAALGDVLTPLDIVRLTIVAAAVLVSCIGWSTYRSRVSAAGEEHVGQGR